MDLKNRNGLLQTCYLNLRNTKNDLNNRIAEYKICNASLQNTQAERDACNQTFTQNSNDLQITKTVLQTCKTN
ncbi:hypothetical protein C0J52_27781, partial [Blattella germanica]